MGVNLTRRLGKLERAIPSKAQQLEHQATWREVFEEFALPADTPIPNHIPIIRCFFNGDGTDTGKRQLRIGDKTVERQQDICEEAIS